MYQEGYEYVQYLGDDGEVGEVGEYFGEAGVISAGAGGQISKSFVPVRRLTKRQLTCYRLKGMKRSGQL